MLKLCVVIAGITSLAGSSVFADHSGLGMGAMAQWLPGMMDCSWSLSLFSVYKQEEAVQVT